MDRVRRGAGPACIAGVVLGALVVGAVVRGFPDLHVYRYGGTAVLHQTALYGTDDPVTGYPFTYPPFAALLIIPLAVVPDAAAAAWAAVLVARPIVWPPWGQGREYDWRWSEQVPGNGYLLAALALTILAARALNRPDRLVVSPAGRCG